MPSLHGARLVIDVDVPEKLRSPPWAAGGIGDVAGDVLRQGPRALPSPEMAVHALAGVIGGEPCIEPTITVYNM